MESKKLILENKVVTYLQSTLKDTDNTLLFLHGWMQDKNSFKEIFSILDTEKISYISLDLPGFGGTQLLSDSMKIEDYGVFVQKFIEKKELKKPILVGHSFGGRISIYLGSFYKNLSKIILIGAAGIAPKMNPFRLGIIKVGKVFFLLPGIQGLGQKIKTKISGEDYKSAGKMTQIYRNTISNDLQGYMKKISYPTIMIWGKDDDQVPIDEARSMNNSIIGSHLEILDGSHFIHKENPEKVSDFILKFIKK